MVQFLPVHARKRTSLACELLLNPSVLIIDVSKTLFLSNHYKNVFLKKIICYALFCKNHQIIHCISKESRNNLILINFKFLDEEKECHIFFLDYMISDLLNRTQLIKWTSRMQWIFLDYYAITPRNMTKLS